MPSLRDQDELLSTPGLEFGSGVIGVCDVCGKRQAVIVLEKERFKLCVLDFLNKTWVGSTVPPGAPLPAYRSERIFFPTDQTPSGKAPAVVLTPTKLVRHPVVLITPDVYGITTTLAEAAIRLAREGFEVLVPDTAKTEGIGPRHHLAMRVGRTFRGGVPTTSPKVDQLLRLYADGLRALRERPMVDPAKVAIFGASYGGTLAIALAAREAKVRVLALAYPMPVRPPTLVDSLAVPVLFIAGGNDGFAAISRIPFAQASADGSLTVEFVDVPGAGHLFLARDMKSYRMAGSEAAWDGLTGFLKHQLFPPPPKPPAPPKSISDIGKPRELANRSDAVRPTA
ncbi:MAG: dienelactone hydrolase family protein [Thermoplasmata archaeon]